MTTSYIVKGTKYPPYMTFSIIYWLLLQESGNTKFFTKDGLKSYQWEVLPNQIGNTRGSYRSIMRLLPDTFERFISQYIKTHYPKLKDSTKIARLDRSYKVITEEGIKAFVLVNSDTGVACSEPCATMVALFKAIVSEQTILSIKDLEAGQAEKMGYPIALPPIDKWINLYYSPEDYLAYVLKRALEHRLPLDYEAAITQFAQDIPEHCDHVAEREKSDLHRDDTRCSCYEKYNKNLAKTGFKIR